MEHLELQELVEHQDLLVLQDHRVNLDQQVLQELVEHQEHQDLLVQVELPDLLELVDRLD